MILRDKIAVGDRGRDFGDVADLAGQVAGHRVDAVGEVLPGSGDARHHRLAAEPSLGAHLARDPRHLAGEGVQLIDHRVDRVLQLEDLAAHVDRDLAGKVASGDRRRHLGDVAHLAGQVGRHGIDAVGQVLPCPGDAGHLRLAAEPTLRADFAGHARYFAREGVQLIDHRIDGLLELQDLAADMDGDLLREIAVGDGGRHFRDIAHLGGQVRAIELTLSVRSFQVPATPMTFACTAAPSHSYRTYPPEGRK